MMNFMDMYLQQKILTIKPGRVLYTRYGSLFSSSFSSLVQCFFFSDYSVSLTFLLSPFLFLFCSVPLFISFILFSCSLSFIFYFLFTMFSSFFFQVFLFHFLVLTLFQICSFWSSISRIIKNYRLLYCK